MSVDGPQTEPLSGNMYEGLLRQAGRDHRLFTVHWELTFRCNQRCSHCYLEVCPPGEAPDGELTTDECLDVVDQIADLGALNLTLSGGEIFVRKDWYEIAAHARAKRLLLRLFSNGVLIRPALADRIAELHPYCVEISLYSHLADVHDGITRVRGSWRRTTEAVRLLTQRGVRVQLKTPLMRENIYAMDELEALAAELGAGFRYGATVTSKDNGGLEPLQHRPDFADLVQFFRGRLTPEIWLRRVAETAEPTCAVATKAAAIDPFGNVSPCVELRTPAGNLRRTRLAEIWQTSPLWKELSGLTLDNLPGCRDCDVRSLCARCHGLALREDGDILGPASINCQEALARRQALTQLETNLHQTPPPVQLNGVSLTTALS